MIASKNALEIIKRFEGFEPAPYRCPAGKLTIGYGHLIKNGESFTKITKEEGEDLLKRDVHFAEDAVTRLVKVLLEQYQFDALVSFVFNLGEVNFSKSTLLRKLNIGDYEGAANEFGKWILSNGVALSGLKARREAEKRLFQGGNDGSY